MSEQTERDYENPYTREYILSHPVKGAVAIAFAIVFLPFLWIAARDFKREVENLE